MHAILFNNGNSYKYECGIRKGNGETRYNLIQWTVNEQKFEKELVQGLHTGSDMTRAKMLAYSQAAGEDFCLVGNMFVRKSEMKENWKVGG